MAVIYHLLSVKMIRKFIWRHWYPFVTRRLQGEEVFCLNYGFEEEPPMGIPLRPADEINRACLQLYHHVATQVPLRGKSVLEVSCGHGGGAGYLARTLEPRSYAAMDLNPGAIRFCRRQHQVAGLVFAQGDSEKLPYAANSFDAVINVEASHCYPAFPRFLAEVERVLRPGGHFLYADFRFKEHFAEWENALASCPLQILNTRVINTQVLRGIRYNSTRSVDLIMRRLPKLLHSLGRDFAGVEGSRVYTALSSGELSYRSHCLKKPC